MKQMTEEKKMENSELLRKREAKRLVDWIKLHRNEWECLCHSMAEDEWELDTEEAVHLLTEFRNGGFYQILIILLSVMHINHWEVREEINFTLFEMLSDVWDEHKVGEITDKIIRPRAKRIKGIARGKAGRVRRGNSPR